MRVSMGRQRGTLVFAKLAQGTVCKILNEQEIRPHKVRYYLERRDPEFRQKMTEVLCVYREVKLIKATAAAAKHKPSEAVAIISYDEKPGIQAIATTALTCRPSPAGMRPSRVTTSTSANARSACWPASICSLAKSTLSSRTATEAANSSNSSSSSTPTIRAIQRSS